MSRDKKIALVTGAPRSGTTFVGRMLALAPQVSYIDEPFNAQTGVEDIKHYFPYLHTEADKALAKKIISGRANLKRSELRAVTKNPLRRLARDAFVSREHLQYKVDSRNPLKSHTIIKDPIAVFSSEFLHREFSIPTIVMMRHPYSTIGSYKRLGWRFNLESLLNQPDLMSDHLQGVIGHINPKHLSAIEEWSYLWLAIHHVLDTYLKRNPDMKLVRHEDISQQPHMYFEELYSHIGLKFSPYVADKISLHTNSQNSSDPRGNAAHDLFRNSAQNIHRWKQLLSLEERHIIDAITKPIVSRYYPDFG